MNETYIKTCHEQTQGIPASTPIHTTLYDLVEAVEAAAGSEMDEVVTDVVSHVLKTYRITCSGDYKGYRMVLDEATAPYSAVA